MKNKNEIRKYIKEKRKNLNKNDKEILDSKIFNKLINSEEYCTCNNIFLYVSFNGEVDTYRIINHALKNNKSVYVPKVVSKEYGMKAVRIKGFNELKKGAYGILEPKDFCDAVFEKDIDLILIPGVAFDLKGARVGYGGGFYDRFLCKVSPKAKKIALAYDFQILDKVPKEEHDVIIDKIITN